MPPPRCRGHSSIVSASADIPPEGTVNPSSWDGAPPSRLHLDNFVGPAPWALFSENRSPAAGGLAIELARFSHEGLDGRR
jgi:hypothetical protein